MKLNFTINIDEVDDIYTLEDEIIRNASKEFINLLLGNHYDRSSLFEKLEARVVLELENVMDINFKNSVIEKVSDKIITRFEKTKQYKALKENEEVMSDQLIKTGLKDMVADLVKSEMKKVFN